MQSVRKFEILILILLIKKIVAKEQDISHQHINHVQNAVDKEKEY